jgi:predicted HTH domain antitoxin
MAEPSGKSRTVQVDLPEEVFESHPWDPERISAELRLLWLLEQVRERRLGHGKAAELSGLTRARFLQIMGQHRITAFDYDSKELEEELS